MIRFVAAIAVALALTPAVLHAQDATLTVTIASADVHKGPSIVTPVIGHVSSGTAVTVLRNLGSWVRVCLLYTSPSPRDRTRSRMPSSA